MLEHVTRLADDLGPDWPQPAGQGGYRVVVKGEPTYTVDLQLMGTDGDHNTGGLKATAMRLVNAVPAVVEAPPGLLTALDLPLDHRTRPRRLSRRSHAPRHAPALTPVTRAGRVRAPRGVPGARTAPGRG